jgi:hypothetical protein
MKKLKTYTLLLFVLFAISSCKKKESQQIVLEQLIDNFDHSFSAKINGVDFNANKLFIIGGYSIQSGIYVLSAIGIRVSSVDTIGIGITFIGENFESIFEGVTYSGSNDLFDNQAVGSFQADYASGNNIEENTGDNMSAEATITAIDTINMVFSGTFSFLVQDSLGVSYSISDGEFTNVSYQ